MGTKTNTHKLRRVNEFNVVSLGKDLQTNTACREFLLHRETALQCHAALHTAEGHRFYVPCMQLVNFGYFVVWCARACVNLMKSRLLSAFYITLIS